MELSGRRWRWRGAACHVGLLELAPPAREAVLAVLVGGGEGAQRVLEDEGAAVAVIIEIILAKTIE